MRTLPVNHTALTGLKFLENQRGIGAAKTKAVGHHGGESSLINPLGHDRREGKVWVKGCDIG